MDEEQHDLGRPTRTYWSMTEWMRLESTDQEGPRNFNGSNSWVELNFKCQLLELCSIQREFNAHGIGRVSLTGRWMDKSMLCSREALAAFDGSSIFTASDG